MQHAHLKAMPSRAAIDQEAHVYLQMREQLKSHIGDADEECLHDTLEGLSSLPDLLVGVVRTHLDDLAIARALRERIAEMRERLGRIDSRAETKRALVASAMESAQMHKLSAPDFTASLRPSPLAVVVLDETRIPTEYWTPQPPKLDKAAVSAALKTGQAVPGATFGSGGISLAIRTK
jgi:hypothetical protein